MADKLRVLLVTTWGTACGIAEHAAYLKEGVEAADEAIEIVPCPTLLNPDDIEANAKVPSHEAPIVHLNYQAALHSRWDAARIRRWQEGGHKVVVTFHDTGVPNSDLCKAVVDAADVTIVHEPAEDLPAEKIRYWRMGVPDWKAPIEQPTSRPTLGSIGFPFGWKNFDQLAKITAQIGWNFFVIANGASPQQVEQWHSLNTRTIVRTDFVPRAEAVAWLAGCDATAFGYVTNGTGQSGALLQGIGARKPVLALSTCRQFRSLFNDPLGRTAITWCETFEDMAFALSHFTRLERWSPAIVALAEQESWVSVGQRYAELYRSLRA